MDRLGSLNSRVALTQLLREVRRRVWLQRLGRALALASWLVLAASAAAAVSSAMSGHASLAFLWLTAGALYLAATVFASLRRPDLAVAAAWADKRLGGASAYAASLEFLGDPSGRHDPAALAHLDVWTAAAAEASRLQLRATPAHWLPTREMGAALAMLALASFTAALFADGRAVNVDGQAAPLPAAPAVATGSLSAVDRLARELAREAQTSLPMRDGTRPAATDPQPVGIEARSGDAAARVSDTTVLAAEAQPGSSGNTSSGGGEQAGRADAGHEAGALTAGELRLRITQRDTPLDAAGRQSAGSGAAGTYQDAGASGSQAPGGPLRAAAAARLPAGSRAWVRGPAQTELVNRYFEERGRQP